jgi:hypothetical protein
MIRKRPLLPAWIRRAGNPEGFRNAETQTLVSMTAAIMPRLFHFSSRKPNFGFDLFGRAVARTLMHVLEERFQGLPASLLALRLINSERAQMLVLVKGDDDCERMALLLKNDGMLQIGNGSAVNSGGF